MFGLSAAVRVYLIPRLRFAGKTWFTGRTRTSSAAIVRPSEAREPCGAWARSRSSGTVIVSESRPSGSQRARQTAQDAPRILNAGRPSRLDSSLK